jgi:molybdopterin synthase catalytic subunit
MKKERKLHSMRTNSDKEINNLDGEYLTEQKIDAFELCDIPGYGEGVNGSLFVFSGMVRKDETEGGVVREIIYETYKEMAEKEIDKIRKEAMKSSGAKEVYIKHRIGSVPAGEASLIVAVLTPHRKEGIKAIDFVIDEIKNRVPIWKKEIFEDGSYRWVEGSV